MTRFLLGVGCQKGGTTWLHDYLSAHPSCRFGFVKEYHLFDSLDLAEMAHRRDQDLQTIASLQQRSVSGRALDAAEAATLDTALRLEAFRADPRAYARHFLALAAEDGVSVVGDITPSYSALSAESLTRARQLLESAGFALRVVFLMRDPVERAYSAIRMAQRNREERGLPPARRPSEVLRAGYAKPGHALRTRYDTTIRTLETVFEPEQVYYGFYETLFSEAEIRRLCAFLGIDYRQPDFDRRINSSPRREEIAPEVAAEVRAYYDATYRFCMARFGADFLRTIWPHARS